MLSNKKTFAKAYVRTDTEREKFMEQIADDINNTFGIVDDYMSSHDILYNLPNNIAIKLCFNQSNNSWFALGFYSNSMIERSNLVSNHIEAFEDCIKKIKWFLKDIITSLPKRINANQII